MPLPQAPLNYEASAGETHHQVTETLPAEVVQCLQNARFLHLATCTDGFPHVALMNYTYLPTSPYSSSPSVIMTTNPSSKKTHNLISNPNVSLLVHDWVSHRPPTTNARRMSADRSGSPPPEVRSSSLATLLANLNTSALSSISATINGEARIVEQGTEEEKYFREMHLENNTFGEEAEGRDRWDTVGSAAPDGGRGTFIEGEEVRVVVVKIRDARVSDWKGAVRDWSLSEGTTESAQAGGLVNGVA
ncbi:FMN-binding split barrel-1 [Coleophoma cylindrospora]|uniref:FMN-binding split barrel-1 n=1 Tax=Coleophoma cylindrospora TaxID=1849047 RepID=A0A3D8RU95_9HELO|nr:FMN-binding split barrel-1 [Coleophoma cylindrospora]